MVLLIDAFLGRWLRAMNLVIVLLWIQVSFELMPVFEYNVLEKMATIDVHGIGTELGGGYVIYEKGVNIRGLCHPMNNEDVNISWEFTERKRIMG